MGKELSPLRRKDIETGRRIEREAIVTWLRESPHFVNSHGIADAIEAGSHLK